MNQYIETRSETRAEPSPLTVESNLVRADAGLIITIVIIVILLGIGVLNTMIQICDPNKILIISGRKYKREDGQELGYRVIYGGRTFRIPILESVETMDVRTIPVPIEVTNAYAKGGTPLNIQAIANVKISGDWSVVGNAIERFLGRGREEISRVARETLEGNLRGVVATLTPEQLNEDRLQFAERISNDVASDLAKLGLQLDTLKIQSVSDDVDYLNSIGRRQIATIVRDAEIAESNAIAEAEQAEADCNRKAEVAETETATATEEKQNELRRITAEVGKEAKMEEERTTAAAEEARARAQQELQSVRAELEKARLEVDQVLPAQAQQQANELEAKGKAAKLAEDNKASAQVNEMLAQVWQETGVDASELFLVQQMEMILKQATKVPHRLHLGEVSVIDNGDGKALASLSNAYPEMIRQFLQQSEETLGIKLSGKNNQDTEQTEMEED
ncbi:flotillin family protein [Euhalothece natronophila Z-M001]|uniref:Flotillin family protein n=1 Tax=Euhalothece natronophila Z-M001 TaxID=522448 RepID=A0A5B8NMZ7_9CHRO|nr:SPFH domain-containing protein [Euhalothece natronophila]QDZ39911.1 flotillin family protein [Euhalothece natronophila Z-M001]